LTGGTVPLTLVEVQAVLIEFLLLYKQCELELKANIINLINMHSVQRKIFNSEQEHTIFNEIQFFGEGFCK
jgi:hypothetical protein